MQWNLYITDTFRQTDFIFIRRVSVFRGEIALVGVYGTWEAVLYHNSRDIEGVGRSVI